MKQELLSKLKTKVLGKNIICYESISSTQTKAREIKEIAENGTIIITNNQTSGIGTHERTWYMGEGENIAFTMILKPKCNISKIENLTVVIAKCMVRAIEKLYGKILDIKLPNDLMCNGKKIGGILTQATTNNEEVKDILIGLGMNVNQMTFPSELKNIATSLKNEFNEQFDRVDIITEFLSIFETEYIKMIA